MPGYGWRSLTGDRSPHSTGDTGGCSVRTCSAGTNIDGTRCSAISTEATAKVVSRPPAHRITGVVWLWRTSERWNCLTAPGKQLKTTRAPKHASKKSNSMWMTTLNQILLNHPTRKVQNSRLAETSKRTTHLAQWRGHQHRRIHRNADHDRISTIIASNWHAIQ